MEKNPVTVKKLPPRYQPPSQRGSRERQNRKSADKKTPPKTTPTSRTSSIAALTKKSPYSGSKKKDKEDPKTSKSKSTKGTASSKRKSEGEKTEKASTAPPVPPLPNGLQPTTIDLPPAPLPPSQAPPPPPPPPSQLPPLPAPLSQASPCNPVSQPKPKLIASSRKGTLSSKNTSTSASNGINLNAIVNARQKLRPSTFGKALGTGEMSNTSDEMACLIRSGAKAENSSLTKDAASFLRKRFEHIKEVTGASDTDSDGEDWD